MQHLDSRLSAIAELFTPGGRGIDVGTDHGYLPVALVQAGKAAHSSFSYQSAQWAAGTGRSSMD